MVPRLKDPSLLKQNICYVDGDWKPAKNLEVFAVTDPATDILIGKCPEYGNDECEEAINAASNAFASFRTMTSRERSKLLYKWYEEIIANEDDIAALITWENGKPLSDSQGEVAYAASFVQWFAEEAPRTYGDTIPSAVPGNRVITMKEPIGVCGLITPWNFPAAMITRKIAPALAAGCTVVCKAPGETPFTALALAELSHRAGIPKGVINVITGLKNTVAIGETLMTHPIVKKVSFTGSTRVGKLLMRQASATLKKLSMELGGNAPFIVFDDSDISTAVASATTAKFRLSGQACVCANRIYVQTGIYEEFAQAFVESVREFSVGNGFNKSSTHGPLIHRRALDNIESLVNDAEAKGAHVLIGGQRMPHLGQNFFQPTVLGGLMRDMNVMKEEIFGPVAVLIPFETEEEVVRLANDCDVGLAGYIISNDLCRALRVAESLEVGMVGVNSGLVSEVSLPFGGVKQSGFGREGSKYGIHEYQVIKSITLSGIK